jgi:hypothetical protein
LPADTQMADILQQLMDFLNANQTDPLTYLLILFLFSVAAAVFLPLPVEIGLIWNPSVFFPIKAVVLGLGKGAGAVIVFSLIAKLESALARLSRWGPLKRLRRILGRIAARLGIDRWRVYGRLKRIRHPRVPETSVPKWGWLRWLSRKSEVFVRRYGILAMYSIMSIPGMLDTIPLYIFSILNREGKLMTLRDFALANFLAGVNRAFLIYAILEILGVRLFG